MSHCLIDSPRGQNHEQDMEWHVVNPEIIDCPLGDGLALFDQRSGEYFSINHTAALMWQSARSPATRQELFEALKAGCGTAANDDRLAGDLDMALRQFVASGLFLVTTASRDSSGE